MTITKNIEAIVWKEWHHYFRSPIGYVALFIWSLLFGVFFQSALYWFLRMSERGPQFGAGGVSLNDIVISGVLHNMAVVTLFVTPLLTMRLFAEEKRQGTMELLATGPITDLEIVLGKFLGAFLLYAFMIAAGFLQFLLLWRFAVNGPDWWPVLSGALALLLLGAAFISLGLFLSTLTKNQIVAAVLTFGLLLTVWVVGWFGEPGSGGWTAVLGYLGLVKHMEDMLKGILDLKDLVYYLSFILLGLFLSYQSVESQRWRA